MARLVIDIPDNFKEELRRCANLDRVHMNVFVMKALQEKFGWPIESIPTGNMYRPDVYFQNDINEEF